MSPPPTVVEDFPEYPPRSALPNLTLPTSLHRDDANPCQITENWISSLRKSIRESNTADLSNLFVEESWWRDLLGLGWEITSKYGPAAISNYVLGSTTALEVTNIITTPPLDPHIEAKGPATYIQAGFTFTTKFGHGRGVVRLACVTPNEWKAWTVSTELERLKENTNGPAIVNGNQETKSEDEFQILVIGAGQCGAAVAAHLQHMNLRYLLIEQHPRVGDSWRNRYDTLKTHTPNCMDHFPFLPYPSTFPKNIPKDQVADWIESYTKTMNLNIATSTTVKRIRRHEPHSFTIDLDVNGVSRTLTSRHIVLSTGLHSDEPIHLRVPGTKAFRGKLYHSSQHKSASQIPNVESKRVTVIGSGTSAHDIAQDFAQHHAKQVTLVQRSPIVFVSIDSLEKFFLPQWIDPCVRVEDKDLIDKSMPNALVLTLAAGASHLCTLHDKEVLSGLAKAGMVTRTGEDGIGLLDHLYMKGGHIYIDHGAAQMIVDGRINVHRCKGGVRELYSSGIEMADGTRIESDVVVTATGFEQNGSVVPRLFGKEVAEKVASHDWGCLDDESERKGWWRPTGFPGLWCMKGAFNWSRQYSGLLAMQIDAIERGYNDDYYMV